MQDMARKWTIVCIAWWLVAGGIALGADEPKKSTVWSNVDVQVYGRLKADASYDTARVTPGDYVKWVERDNDFDRQFNLTANETRLGLNIKGPDAGSAKTSGKVEIDFYGTGSTPAENKPEIMMRHAYAVLEWPHWSLLAGQTSDIVSPLAPRTLNYSVLWWAGNIGYRRPQIRLTRQYNLCKDTFLKFDGGISRTIGENTIDNPNAGEASGVPTAQARVGLTMPYFGGKPGTVGLSGHYGTEEYSGKVVPTWSVNLDATMPLASNMTLKAEWFLGENMDAFLGGIGQGVRGAGKNLSTLDGIRAQGGWGAVEIEAGKGWSFTGGIGIDDPDHQDLNPGDRDLNRSIFGNAIYSLSKNAKLGFELTQWRTEYVGTGGSDDTRGQFSVIYEF
jgi:hypothetical protein